MPGDGTARGVNRTALLVDVQEPAQARVSR
jgi:hypothetical protein